MSNQSNTHYLLACVLLLAASTRLFTLNRHEVKSLKAAHAREALEPTQGSLWNPAIPGVARRDVDTTKTWQGRSLLFGLRSDNLEADVKYWNMVVSQIPPQDPAVRFWGICDNGGACDRLQGIAAFPIAGFLDPFQMRMVARAHGEGFALLYEKDTLKYRVPVLPAFSDTAAAMAKRMTQ